MSSPGPLSRKRRSVDEEAGIAELAGTVAETGLACFTAEVDAGILLHPTDDDDDGDEGSPSRQRSPPPQYPASEASGSSAFRPPPSFSSLFPTADHDAAESHLDPCEPYKATPGGPDDVAAVSAAAPAYAPPDQVAPEPSNSASAVLHFRDETKRALPQDTKGHAGEQSSRSSKDEETEPPPAYSEGTSPLQSFTYLMAAAGGASSIITQVQQGGQSINPLGGRLLFSLSLSLSRIRNAPVCFFFFQADNGPSHPADVPGDETISMDLR